MQPAKTLVFVYNIDSGVLAKIKDYAGSDALHEMDGCRLYILTNSPIGMKKKWRRFIRELGMPARFLNRNEFLLESGTGPTTFPAVFVQVGEDLSLAVTTGEINRCQSLEALISLIQLRFTGTW